nr:hypothetical protein [Undibacterium oligocarboniphilum]
MLGIGLLSGASVYAHGGEDHGDAGKTPPPAIAITPRATAQSEDFELVAVLDESQPKNRRLLITVDRFKTNEPVSGAKLEIDAGGQNTSATEDNPGVYVASFAALNKLTAGSKLPLTISLETNDTSDLLSADLEIPAAPLNEAESRHRNTGYAAWGVGAAFILAAIIVLIARRRHPKKGAQ